MQTYKGSFQEQASRWGGVGNLEILMRKLTLVVGSVLGQCLYKTQQGITLQTTML